MKGEDRDSGSQFPGRAVDDAMISKPPSESRTTSADVKPVTRAGVSISRPSGVIAVSVHQRAAGVAPPIV